jgi:uncharacterized membrane protein YgdD (TMEM256/DUF423 family)
MASSNLRSTIRPAGMPAPDAPMSMRWVAIGAVSAAIAVAAGAFGAHGLRARLPVDMLAVFEIAVRYQMYHALALVAVGLALAGGHGRPRLLRASGWLFAVGTVAFCGSLYLLSLGGVRWLGAVAPVGGAALIGGWLCLALAARRAGAAAPTVTPGAGERSDWSGPAGRPRS